jgi:fatty acid desaturase
MNGTSYHTSYNLVQAIRGPIMLILLGTLVAMDYFGVYGFSRTWPILIIAFGFLKLLEKLVAHPVAPPPPVDNSPQGGNVI